MSWSATIFSSNDAPADLVDWASAQPTLRVAWSGCDRLAWLFWLSAHLARSADERQHVIRSALFVLRRAAPLRFAWPPWHSPVDAATAWAHRGAPVASRGRLGPTRALLLSFAGASVAASAFALATNSWLAAAPAFALTLLLSAAQIARSDHAFIHRAQSEFDFEKSSAAILFALRRCDERMGPDRRIKLADVYRDVVSQPGWLRLV